MATLIVECSRCHKQEHLMMARKAGVNTIMDRIKEFGYTCKKCQWELMRNVTPKKPKALKGTP